MRILSRLHGLYFKFTLLLVVLASLPVAFLGYQLVSINQAGIQAAVLELHTKLVEKFSESVEKNLQDVDEKLLFAREYLRSEKSWSGRQRFLRNLLETHSDFEEFAVVNSVGQELLKVYRSDRGELGHLCRHADAPAFREFQKSGRRVLFLDASGRVPRLQIYDPLPSVGGLFASVSLERIWRQIRQERVGGTGFALWVDAQRRVLSYPEERVSPARVAKWPILSQALGGLSVGSSEFSDEVLGEMVGAYSPIHGLGGAVVLVQPKEEAYQASQRMRRRANGVLALVVFLAILIAYGISRQLTRPILSLIQGAQAVAAGDFTRLIHLRTQDELQDLAETFNAMTVKLREYSDLQVDRLISEKKKTEAIIFSIADGILVTDYHGRIQVMNRAAREIFGLKDEEAVEGRALAELILDTHVVELLEDVLKKPGERVTREITLSRVQYRRVMKLSTTPVITQGRGLQLGLITAFHDVTFEREMDRIKEEFLHSITHDLKNPMTSIRGFVRFLLDGVGGPLSESQRRMLESVDKASLRLLGMINDILDIAKLEAGKMELCLAPCNLAEVASHSVEIMDPLIRKKRIDVKIDADVPVELVADEALFERVFTNLISNSVKFTPEEGRITLSFKMDPDQVEVCVRDTGEGIPPAYLDKIFDKFQQVMGQRRGGTGLGLTICRHIVESHKGRIWVESVLGQGSNFIFVIPRNLTATPQNEIQAVHKIK